MRLALALLVLASPAYADSSLSWGIPFSRTDGPNQLNLSRCDDGTCFAQVTFRNSQLRGMALTRTFALQLDGLEISVTVTDGDFRRPESFAVTAPPGFYAEPPTLIVNEDETGIISILAVPMS